MTCCAVGRELSRLGIACQMTGKTSVYESTEALEIAVWLKLLSTLEDGDGDHQRAVRSFAHTALIQTSAPHADHSDQQVHLLALAQQHLAHLQREGPLPMLRRHLDTYVNLSDIEAERRWSNWLHIMRLLQDRWWNGRRHARALHEALLQNIEQPPGEEHDDCMVLETDEPAVQLVTIHGSKGLNIRLSSVLFYGRSVTPKYSKASEPKIATAGISSIFFPSDRKENVVLDKKLEPARARTHHLRRPDPGAASCVCGFGARRRLERRF